MSGTHLDADAMKRLVARYLEHGDEQAVEDLVQLTRSRLLAAARRIGRSDDAEDAVQVAYLSLVRHRGTPMDAPVFSWLLTATIRVAYRKKAAHQRQADIARALATERFPGESGGADPTTSEVAALVRAKIADLPPRYRDVLYLHCVAGLSQADVARLLDEPIATVRTQLHRGRGLLRSKLSPRMLGSLCAGPWWLADQARALSTVAGGWLMGKKTVGVTAAALALAVGGGTWGLLSGNDVPPRDGPEIERVEAEHRDDVPTTAPTLHASSRSATPARPGDAPPAAATFRGRVVDAGGAPVSGARIDTIAVRRPSGGGNGDYVYSRIPRAHLNVVSGKDGTFSLRPQNKFIKDSASALDLRVRAEGHPLMLAQVRRDEPAEIVLRPAGTLRVLVLDPDGEPASDVEVGLLVASNAWQTTGHFDVHPFLSPRTDTRGWVEVPLLDGSYRLRVAVAGRPTVLTGPMDHTAAAPLEHTVTLSRGVTIRARVMGDGNQPVAGATVMIGSPREPVTTHVTDDDGWVERAGLPLRTTAELSAQAGAYWDSMAFLYVTAEGYAPLEFRHARPAKVMTFELDLRMSRGRPVEVRVVDDAGQPIEGATVSVGLDRGMSNPLANQRSLTFRTDRVGRAGLGRLTEHQNLLTVRAHGHEWFHKKVAYPEEGDLQITLRRQGASVTGRALGPDGKPVDGMRVGWAPADLGYARSAQHAHRPAKNDGSFQLENLVGGQGHLVLRAPGYAPQLTPLALDPGGPTEGVVARLVVDGKIGGVVVRRDGTPLDAVELTMRMNIALESGARQSANVATARTDAEGRFSFLGVPEGEVFRVSARKKEWVHSDWLKTTKVRRGQEDLRIVMKPKSEGSGIALPARITVDGTPYDGPIALQWPKGDKGPYAGNEKESSDPGVRRFSVWTGEGTYTFTFEAPGFRPYVTRPIRLRDVPDLPTISVPLDRGAVLRLRVRVSGEPLANTELKFNAYWKGGHSYGSVTTNADGECALGGFIAGQSARLLIHRQDDTYTSALLESVLAPDDLTLTLRRYGQIHAKSTLTYGEIPPDGALAILLQSDGAELERTAVEPRTGKRAERRVWASFKVYEPGRYTVRLVVGDRTWEAEASLAPGQSVRPDLVEID